MRLDNSKIGYGLRLHPRQVSRGVLILVYVACCILDCLCVSCSCTDEEWNKVRQEAQVQLQQQLEQAKQDAQAQLKQEIEDAKREAAEAAKREIEKAKELSRQAIDEGKQKAQQNFDNVKEKIGQLIKPAEPPQKVSAFGFAYPVPNYKPGSFRNRIVGSSNSPPLPPNHTGEDVALNVGDPVYAVADGYVVLAKVAQSYGWVVVIEHTLPDGRLVNSIYGHLAPSKVVIHNPKPGANLQFIARGELVGYIGNKNENGGFGPHLHMGLRIVGMKRDYRPGVGGYWYRGYGQPKDIGTITPDFQHTGGPYVPFSALFAQ